MNRLPKLPIVGVFLLLVFVALPAVSQTKTLEGTWLLIQDLDRGLQAGHASGLGAPLAYELLHFDADAEVREQSSLFQPGSCGQEAYLSFGVPMRVPFTASPGIGHWALADDTVKISAYHLLYDCLGNAIGIAWAVREGKAVYGDLTGAPSGAEAQRSVVAWEGTTTISFFTLTGDPLPLPIFLMPILPGTDVGVTTLSGSFRAQRAFGEPTRPDHWDRRRIRARPAPLEPAAPGAGRIPRLARRIPEVTRDSTVAAQQQGFENACRKP